MSQGKGGAAGSKLAQLRALVQSPQMVALRTEKPPSERLSLARNPDTPPEVLFVLSHDDDPAVRDAVAHNASTPRHADEVLSRDTAVDVRRRLAQRLTSIAARKRKPPPTASTAAEALGLVRSLSRDAAAEVRAAVAATLRDVGDIPAEMALALARDYEQAVAAPMLMASPLITEKELPGLIGHHRESWALDAIARRPSLKASATDPLLARRQIEPTRTLLDNASAELSEEGLAHAVETAREAPDLAPRIAQRPGLTSRVARALARVAGHKVGQLLAGRSDLKDDVRNEISRTVNRRLAWRADRQELTAEQAVAADAAAGTLGDQAVQDALALDWDAYVAAALAHLAGVKPQVVTAIRGSDSGKSVMALSLLAGLEARTGLDLQVKWADIPPDRRAYPRQGSDYPLDAGQAQFQLELFGVIQ